jgi:hypothetical protein
MNFNKEMLKRVDEADACIGNFRYTLASTE